jgi:hypothetical protein
MHRRDLWLTLAGSALLPAAARAHHGWGSYDAQQPITLSGPVRTLAFANPHVHVDVQQADGSTWEVTLAPPSRMQSRGAIERVLPVGTTITAHGYPSRVRERELRAEWIEVAGTRYQMR